jgi:hypothetical protein
MLARVEQVRVAAPRELADDEGLKPVMRTRCPARARRRGLGAGFQIMVIVL